MAEQNCLYDLNQYPIPFIMAAGSGTRLFPMSTKSTPKQFIKLENKYSLLQNTVMRLSKYPKIIITTMEKYINTLEQQLDELNLSCQYTIIVVPPSYNTAYSICAVSLIFKEELQNIIAIPSDKIFNEDEFVQLMDSANNLLNKKPDKLLFLGKTPTYAATGFGYLQCSDNKQKVVRFIEKPTLDKAKKYFTSGNYYWNCGVVGFVPKTMNSKYTVHRPDIMYTCQQALKGTSFLTRKNLNIIVLLNPTDSVEDISIDYAINEKLTENEMTFIPFNGKLDDVGSWNSVHEILEKNNDGINKDANCKSYKSNNCLLMTKKPIYLNGVRDLVIIETDECIMISHMDKTQDVKLMLMH